MPNWCDTHVVFYGEQDKVDKLYQDLTKALDTVQEGDDGWYGRLLVYHGFDKKTIDSIYSRGFVYDTELTPTGLYISSADACEPVFAFYNFVAKLYDLNYCLLAEEPGTRLYLNTDLTGKYFPQQYLFEFDMFEDIPQTKLIKKLQKLADIRYFTDFDEIKAVMSDYNIDTEDDMAKLCRDIQNRFKDSIYINFAVFAE